MRPSCWIAAAVLVIAGGGVAAQQPAASPAPARNVRELVARAGRYVVDYGEKLSLVVGVERYAQRLQGAGATEPQMRTLVSEFALVRAAGDWMGFRDVFEVDGAAVRDRQDRLVTLLLGRSSDRLLQGRQIADESARYNLGPVRRNFNTPTAALFFLQPENQSRFRFAKDGEDTVDGTRVWRVTYRETDRPTIVRTTTGRDAPASGTFWIDPVHGRVVRTSLEMRTEIEQAVETNAQGGSRAPVQVTVGITVSYEPNVRFGLLLPSEMRELYEVAPARRTGSQDTSATVTCVAAYSDFRTFETFGRLIVR
jgi:hypothetical protein